MGWAALGIAAEKSIEEKYVALAASASVFNTEGLCYGHSPFQQDSPETAKEKAEHEQFQWLTKHATRQESEKLLHHSDPKVRLLAVGTLFNTEDPQALPAIAKLAGDKSETLPLPGMASQARIPASPSGKRTLPQTRTQTVGEASMMLLNCYMKAAGCYYNPQGSKQDSEFADYWSKYGTLDHCLSWFAVRLSRAMRGSRPPSPECQPEILLVRKQIDQLPENDRVWVLLGLRDEYEDFDEQFGPKYANMLASREELLQDLNKLGPAQVLEFLQRKKMTSDPDFQPDGNMRYQSAAKRFILKNAAQIFRSQDADALVEQGRLEYGKSGIKEPFTSPLWWLAASNVRPKDTGEIVLDGLKTMQNPRNSNDQEVLPLLQKLWQSKDEGSMEVIAAWFFNTAERSRFNTARAKFIEDIAQIKKPSGRIVLASLLQDPQAESIENPVLGQFASAVNTWVSVPVATVEEIKQLKGQTWKGGGVAPELVPGMLDRLRKSIPQWKAEH